MNKWKIYNNSKLDSNNTYQSLKYYSDDNIDLVRIALKKEKDRKNKLEKFLQKFVQIEDKEKKSSKLVKAFIIELKDVEATQKLKLFVDPSIFVDSKLKVETRQFLSVLLNTFYKTYDEYRKTSKKITQINESLAYLIKQISYSEEMLVANQKFKIVEEIKLQGQLLNEKNKLKEITARKKRIEQEYDGVNEVYCVSKKQYDKKKNTNFVLREHLVKLKNKLNELNKNIIEQQNIRSNCRDQISQQLTYQNMFKSQLSDVTNQLELERKKGKKIEKQLFKLKANHQSMQNTLPLCQSIKHNVKVQMMESRY